MKHLAVMTLALLFAASARAQSERAKTDKAPRSQEFATAEDEYNGYINRTRGHVWKNDEANLPFMLSQGQHSARSIVLVHGLTDSPYYMHELGEIFFKAGYNVIGVRLQGHGTKPEDLQKVTRDMWQDDVKTGIDIAQHMGDEVSLAGFSTGGAMVLDAVGKNEKLPEGKRFLLGDVYLFSPAVELNEDSAKKVAATCTAEAFVPGVHGLIQAKKPWVNDEPEKVVEDNPHGYRKMATNAVCQLYRQIVANRQNRKEIDAGLKGHGVFIVESMADKTVSPLAVPNFQQQLPGGLDWDLSLYPAYNQIPHAAVTRSETNPHFGAMKDRIESFIERCKAEHAMRDREGKSGLRDLSLLKK